MCGKKVWMPTQKVKIGHSFPRYLLDAHYIQAYGAQ